MPAGSKPGERRGGRKPGTPNKRDAALRDKLEAGGLMPLEVMLNIMRTAYEMGDHETALDSAKGAAPYIHPRLNSTSVTGIGGGPVDMSMTIRFVST
jgi:hypothetical protein